MTPRKSQVIHSATWRPITTPNCQQHARQIWQDGRAGLRDVLISRSRWRMNGGRGGLVSVLQLAEWSCKLNALFSGGWARLGKGRVCCVCVCVCVRRCWKIIHELGGEDGGLRWLFLGSECEMLLVRCRVSVGRMYSIVDRSVESYSLRHLPTFGKMAAVWNPIPRIRCP